MSTIVSKNSALSLPTIKNILIFDTPLSIKSLLITLLINENGLPVEHRTITCKFSICSLLPPPKSIQLSPIQPFFSLVSSIFISSGSAAFVLTLSVSSFETSSSINCLLYDETISSKTWDLYMASELAILFIIAPSALFFGFGIVSRLQGNGFFPSNELEVIIYTLSVLNSTALSIIDLINVK